MPKEVLNKRYTPKYKKTVIETMQQEGLSYAETSQRCEINSHQRICDWGRIYLTEEPEAFAIKCRERGSTRRLGKLRKEAEEDLLAEVQRLRTENEYLKNLQAFILEDKRRQHKNAGSSGVKAKTLSRYSSLNGSRM